MQKKNYFKTTRSPPTVQTRRMGRRDVANFSWALSMFNNLFISSNAKLVKLVTVTMIPFPFRGILKILLICIGTIHCAKMDLIATGGLTTGNEDGSTGTGNLTHINWAPHNNQLQVDKHYLADLYQGPPISSSRFHPRPRVKRQSDPGNCTRTTINPLHVAQPSFTDLLKIGYEYLSDQQSMKEAILLLGNPGSGKTELAQILSNDLSGLRVVLSENGKFVIVDDLDRVGSSYPNSKQVSRQQPNSSQASPTVLHCPSFPHQQQITQQLLSDNFLMTQIINTVTRVKLLFNIDYSSLTGRNGKVNFDLLVSNAITFLMDIPKYSRSIGLIINQVPSLDEHGYHLSDLGIKTDTTAFLQLYKNDLELELFNRNANSTWKEMVERKLTFLGTLLEQNANGEYGRISFSRSLYFCGPLNDSETVADNRKRILKLCSEELTFNPVDRQDFDLTLKSTNGLSRILAEYEKIANEQIAQKISALIKNFKDRLDKKVMRMTDISLVTSEVRKSSNTLEVLVRNLNALGNTSSPLDYFEKMALPLETLGYRVPAPVENFMMQKEAYFQWLDGVSSHKVISAVGNWTAPVEGVQKELSEYYLEWYDFCEKLQLRVESYNWQLNTQAPPPNFRQLEGEDWLNYLGRVGGGGGDMIPLPNNIRGIASQLGKGHVETLSKIMRYAMRPLEVQCEGGNVTISGNFIRFSEFISWSWPLITPCHFPVDHLEIYGAHTIFIDRDVEAEGMELNLVMMAPNWVVIDGGKHINLDGTPGVSHSPGAADNGQNSNNGEGFRGNDGLAGKPGGPSGSFFGFALTTKDIGRLMITSTGGKGGPGQTGGNGGSGGERRDATWVDTSTKLSDSWSNIFQKVNWYDHPGFAGHKGGNGGNGGMAGEGGKSGRIRFFIKSHMNSTNKISIIQGEGMPGDPGLGGKGGQAGPNGKGLHCREYDKLWGLGTRHECSEREFAYEKDQAGSNGDAGRSLIGKVKARPPRSTIVEWQSILNYKFSVVDDEHSYSSNATRPFLRFLREDSAFSKFADVKGFIKELKLISKATVTVNSHDLLSSFISKVEDYQRENYAGIDLEHKKVLRYLLITAYSQLVSLEQNHGMGMVIDVRRYFELVKTKMERFRSSSALVAMDAEVHKLKQDLWRKVQEIRRFLDEVVNPAIHHAEVKLRERLYTLETQLEDLVRNAEHNFRTSKKVLVQAILGNDEEVRQEVIKDSLFTALKALSVYFTKSLDVSGEDVTSVKNLVENMGDLLGANSRRLESRSYRRVSCLGEGRVSKLQVKFRTDRGALSNLSDLLQQAGDKLKDTCERKDYAQRTFIPLVETLREVLTWLMTALQEKSEANVVGSAELGIEKWKITRSLRDVKVKLAMMEEGVDSREFENAVDRIQEALTMKIELFDQIVKYEESVKLAENVASVNSAHLRNVHVGDPTLSAALGRMEKAVAWNQLRKEYNRALHAFKQWVFPFAKLHLTKDLEVGRSHSQTLSMDEDEGQMKMEYLERLKSLTYRLDDYGNATADNVQDTNIIHTVFSSDAVSSSPFFVWKNEEWPEKIVDLLAGKPVRLEADVRSSQIGRDAVKFKQIEINFNLSPEIRSQRVSQQKLDEELRRFGVIMVHSGVSYYRFQGDFYVMVGANQTIRYNFERDGRSGNRLGTNRIYQKFMSGDYLLSPYTSWTFQLIGANPRSNFRVLERFAPYVNLELVGMGIYVDGERMRDDMEVGKYYEMDDSIREGVA